MRMSRISKDHHHHGEPNQQLLNGKVVKPIEKVAPTTILFTTKRTSARFPVPKNFYEKRLQLLSFFKFFLALVFH
jgi:hypothetical protein